MTPLDDHSQRRRPLFIPVVIATAVLTVGGLVTGYLLSRGREPNNPEPGISQGPSLLTVGPLCRPETQAMGEKAGAVGELRQVLRVRTESRTVVWICQDEEARLYYHANKGGGEAKWVENKTALFLANVRHNDAGEFWAAAEDGAIFVVTADKLIITHEDGRAEEQDVVPE
ncbi:hypothetical protein [Actinoplanes hulinensis]|uniref:hypothetical protein n=1 Tax=Actinoplanes hulinensis TaxID=1144547 RepID=UPI0027E3ABEB|nr:hypothetical protein [Actinoplanes hulinensis]